MFLFNKNGVFINSIPEEVNVLELTNNYKIFTKGLRTSIETFLKNGQIYLAYYRLMFTIKNRVIKNNSISEQYTWKYQSKSLIF